MEARTNALKASASAFIRKVETRKLNIAIIGMGYVGLPLAEAFLAAGFAVTGIDKEDSRISLLKAGQSHIKHIADERVRSMTETGRFVATTRFDSLGLADAVLICVPTPLDGHRNPDLSHVIAATQMAARCLRPGQLIVLESTTYPGTCAEIMRPVLEAGGLRAGEDFALAYSPEREDPGNTSFKTASIPKIVGANTRFESAMACALYRAIVHKVVEVSDLRTAEAVKLTENIFRAVNIALVNELKLVFTEMDIDIWEVIEAAKTKPFGFMPFYPGPGLGGHCVPIDPFYLTWKAKEFGLKTRFIELAGEINSTMPGHVIVTMAMAMNDRLGMAIKGARVLVAGVAYKKNVADMRESPSLELMKTLQQRGAHVAYHDPHIPVIPRLEEYPDLVGMRSVEWTESVLKTFDVVLIATDHDGVDYNLLLKQAPLVIDTRNVLGGFASDTIVKA